MTDSVEMLINQVEKLPTINTVAFEVIQLCSDKEIPIPRLVKVVSSDQSLTAQILKVANSSYFNYPRTIYSLDRAIVILGFNLLKDIAVSLSIFSVYRGFQSNKYIDVAAQWKHSLVTGIVLKSLADNYDPENKDFLYVSGLLHDIGKLVLFENMGEDYYLLQEKSRQEQKQIYQFEKKFFSFTHAEVGARLLEKWQLPASTVASIEYHHEPDLYTGENDISPWIRLVYLGNLFAHLLEEGKTNREDMMKLDPDFEKQFSLPEGEFSELMTMLTESLNEHSEYISLFETGTL